MTIEPLHKMASDAESPKNTGAMHLAAFDGLRPSLPGSDLGWLDKFRCESLERFRHSGVPHRGIEEWKFTSLDALTSTQFTPRAEPSSDIRAQIDSLNLDDCAARLVFMGGRFCPDVSLLPSPDKGITITSFAEAIAEHPALIEGHLSGAQDAAQSLVDLNAAFMADGALVHLDDGASLENPIALIFIATGADHAAFHTRNLITLGKNSRATVLEAYLDTDGSPDENFTNAVTDIHLGEGAHLTHLRTQEQGADAIHASRAIVTIGKNADYASFALAAGARLSRQETDVTYTGTGAHARLFGAYLGRGSQHLDHTIRVDHAVPGCTTEEIFKGVLDDRSHGVFQGMIRVAPGAMKTDARQKNQTLLLSDRAAVDTKPELEILADDVKCAHGATVGDLDPDALFYLAARGISPAEARQLLVAGFIDDLLDKFSDETVTSYLRSRIVHWQEEE